MSELAALQDAMAQALLHDDFAAVAPWVLDGPISAAEALSVHRNTALHGLVNALRLSHPTVDALVGEAFFDQAALAFARRTPPSGAWLTGYGEGFAAFLQTYDLAAALPYLADAARFDFAAERVAGLALGEDGPVTDLGEATLTLDASLTLFTLDHPIAALRDALDEGEAALARIDMSPRPQVLAMWRRPEGAAVRVISAPSAAVLQALQQGGDLDAVLDADSDLTALQAEVFAAPFARIAAKSQPRDQS